jgi:hypothetical protein
MLSIQKGVESADNVTGMVNRNDRSNLCILVVIKHQGPNIYIYIYASVREVYETREVSQEIQ